MPVISIREAAGFDSSAVIIRRRPPVVEGACLLLLLMFASGTAFVRDSWTDQSFEIGVFALVAVYLLVGIRTGKEKIAGGWTPWLVYLIPVWGLVQIAAHTTSSQADTREGLLRWAAYAGVFFLGQVIGRGRQARRNLLTVLLVFSTAMAALCLMQMFSSEGKVLWYFPTDFSVVFATYVNYDAYAMLIELALPIALWRGVTEGWRSWQYPLAAGLMYASVIGSASRMGTALCTVELLGLLAIGLVRMRDPETGLPTRSTASILLVIPVIAIAFTLTVGWQHVVQRFHDSDPYQVRREFLAAAVDMAKQRPAMGYGLGTFPEVYQRYAIRDFPFYANHAHNDWAEFAADGGIPFLLLVLIPFAAAIPAALRHAWGIGLIAIMAHACVDFPYPRVSVAGWLFLMLGLLYSARDQEAKE